MSDFRVRYGLALGPYGTLAITSALNVLPAGDTTPDITLGSYFIAQNTSPTAISYFDGRLSGGLDGVEEGKIIVVRFADAGSTTLINGGRMFLAESAGAFLSNQMIALLHSNSAWYELFRSYNSQGDTTVSNVGAANIAPNVDGVHMLILNATAATTLIGLSGGQLGQQVVIFSNSGGSNITVSTAGNLTVAGSAVFVMNTSAPILAFKRNSTTWSIVRTPLTAA